MSDTVVNTSAIGLQFENFMTNLDRLYDAFNELFGAKYLAERSDLRLYIPEHVFDFMISQFTHTYLVAEELKSYRGVPIVQNWENSIVLGHYKAQYFPGPNKPVLRMTDYFKNSYKISKVD